MQQKLQKVGLLERVIMLLILGAMVGVACGFLFRSNYIEDFLSANQAYTNILENTKLNHIALLRYTIIHNCKSLLIFWALCITILGVPYMIFSIMYRGFKLGFLVTALVLSYGPKGVVLCLSFCFPQCLVYIPVCLICLRKGYDLVQKCYRTSNQHISLRKSMILEYIVIMFFLFLLLLIGSVLETYICPSVIYRALKLCQI